MIALYKLDQDTLIEKSQSDFTFWWGGEIFTQDEEDSDMSLD